VAVAAAGAPAAARANEGRFMVRLRGVYLAPSNRSDAIPALSVPADAIHVSDKVIPELDLSWFFTQNLSAELVLTYPQKHDATLAGSSIRDFSHLPPTLTAQWHFLPGALVNPYVGAGLNFTLITSTNLQATGVGPLDLSSPSLGFAAQAGVDVRLAEHWYANADVKYAMIRADVKAGGAKVSEARVDPLLLGAGIGYRF